LLVFFYYFAYYAQIFIKPYLFYNITNESAMQAP
jgi:hypothetical protein